MLPYKEIVYENSWQQQQKLFFVADIGGTNSNFGVCGIIDGAVKLLYSLHIKSRNITDFAQTVCQVLEHINKNYTVALHTACFGVAGVVSEQQDFCKPTNAAFAIDTNEIIRRSCLESAVLINDFSAVAYGLDVLDGAKIKTVYQGTCKPYGQKAIIGAGTGLGKAMMIWSDEKKRYLPLASEGGHADFPVVHQEEFDLIAFIRERKKVNGAISWEDILSGNGIQSIYSFLGSHRTYQASDLAGQIQHNGLNPDEIFAYQAVDKQCNDTVEMFARFYGRCAKDFALESLALNGLYIAGGIAAKNIAMFSRPVFMQEFFDNHKQQALLQCIPIYLIADYNVSLYGAAVYLLLHAA